MDVPVQSLVICKFGDIYVIEDPHHLLLGWLSFGFGGRLALMLLSLVQEMLVHSV